MSFSQHQIVPVKVFYSYSHKDEKLRNKLDNHLTLLQRQGLINEWTDRMIEAGEDWEHEISAQLNTAQLILLLISDDFIASDYCYSVEMERALERHKNGEARVIPILLRPVDWESSPFGLLQALPKDAKPVTTWKNRDEAFKNIAQGIRVVIKEFSNAKSLKTSDNDANQDQAKPVNKVKEPNDATAPILATNIRSSKRLRVFLCHSSRDKSIVHDLFNNLLAEGFDPWLYEESLIAGQDWDKETIKALRNSDVVILCLSQDSIAKSGYVQKEIKQALDVADEQPDGTIYLIPLRIEECEVPARLGRWHWVNLYEEHGYQRLKRALQIRASTLGLNTESSGAINEKITFMQDPRTINNTSTQLTQKNEKTKDSTEVVSVSLPESNSHQPNTLDTNSPEDAALQRQLVDEINLLLEDGGTQVSSIIRKAIRLAALCGDQEHRLLFDAHLDGADLTGSSGSRIEKWSDSNKPPKWDVTAAFYEDRSAPNGQSVGISLNEIESRLRQIPEMRARMAAKRNHAAANELVEAKLMFSDILGRIRNRIGNFVRQVERELPENASPSAQKIKHIKRTSMSKGKGIVIAISVAAILLIIAYGLYVYKSSQADSPKMVKYTGRVVDSSTKRAVPGAKVSVETRGVPQVYYTDSDGIFYLEISAQMDTPRIRIEATGYEVFDRNVSLSRTGIEDIRLTSLEKETTPVSPEITPSSSSVNAPNANTATANTKARRPLKTVKQKNSPYDPLNYNGP